MADKVKAAKAPVKGAAAKSVEEKNKGGRPLKYGPETKSIICALIASGKSLTAICKMDGMPHIDTVFTWMLEDAEFSERYTRARETQADVLADEILDIADEAFKDYTVDADGNQVVNQEAIQRSRLRVDARKWIASKLKPKKYGDKLALGGADDLPKLNISLNLAGDKK